GSRPPVLELPTDYPRPPMLTHQGAHYRVDLPSHLVWALKDLAQETETTLFMVLLAAFNILLSRYSHQEDICVGVPTANRNRSELEKLIGFFVNTLVMRTDLSAAPTFLELLERVRATTLAAQSNQDIPFEMLVEHLQPNRDMSHMPLFQVMFELQETPLDGLHLGGLQIDLLPVETGTAKFDLSLTMTNTETGLTAEFEYNTTLFAPETICRMAGHFQVLLAAIAADPEQSITTLPLLTAAEQRQLLVEWNDTAVPYPHDRCLHHLFHEQAAKTPNATAVVAENGRLTYAELDQKANQLAHYLQKQGVTRNTIVGLLMDRSVEMIIGLIGILKAGAAYLPIDPDYPTGRITTMIADAQPKVILTQSSINKKQKTKNSQQKTADNQQLTINNSNHSPFTIHPSADSGQANSQFIILDADWPLIAQEPATTPTTNTEPEDMAYLIYTSGSTGKPKGVMVPHRAALNLLTGLERIIYDTLAQRPLRLSLNATICFDASVQQVVMLLRGHALHIIPQEIRGDGPALLHYIQKHRLHVLDCVPTQLRLLLEAGLLTTNGWTPAAVLPGGEAIDQETWQMLAKTEHIRFFNMYGPTECAVDSTICPVHEYPQQPTIGRPIINAHTYILDQHQQPVPIGVSGELHLGGAGVGLGYLHRPQLTAEKFIPLSVIGNQ
ncbi:MAG: AMP-binding protein, partial [Anaerolineae bacterium]